jgi:CubicO group peptidase (beta-lactamase class C family)
VLTAALVAWAAVRIVPGQQRPRYPGTSWAKAPSPDQAGWSTEKLRLAQDYSESIGTAALMIVVDGTIVYEWGNTSVRHRSHSMRKSFLSALYGIYVDEGKISLSSTIEELGIDDVPPLTASEKKARVVDLLAARSGVYHVAAAEADVMRALRPARGSHPPGSFWYYNNWDFNALGTILEAATKLSIGDAFLTRIAEPLGMEDFRARDVSSSREPVSVHPAYPFRMSARDAARFGLLYLRKGAWDGRQIVPRRWVEESTAPHSSLGPSGVFGLYGAYGYLWWVAPDGKQFPEVDLGRGAFSAQGGPGQLILVAPEMDLVLVHLFDTDRIDVSKTDAESDSRRLGRLLKLVVDAAPGR